MTKSGQNIVALTFDMFGTILNLIGSITPAFQKLVDNHQLSLSASDLWNQFRSRQRIEQYQDNLLMLGHCGYLEAVRRAVLYVLRSHNIPYTSEDVSNFLDSWKQLQPFPDALDGLERLKQRYQLVVLSNGEQWFLEHLTQNQVPFNFDKIVSVQKVGAFKPHPAVYRSCAQILQREPGELLMVSGNSFDVLGSRACGYQAAWIRRTMLPYEETTLQPTMIVNNFQELAARLL